MTAGKVFRDGADCLTRGDIAGAERAAQILLENAPDANALHLLALVRLRQERLDEALVLLEKSLAIRPGEVQVLFNRGKLLALMERDAEAVTALSDLLICNATLAEAWYELGEVLSRLGEDAASEDSFRKLLALQPGHMLGKLALGLLLKKTGRLAQSEMVFAQGLAEAGDTRLEAAFAYNLALTQYEQGQKDNALASFTLVSKLDPSSSADLSRADLLQEMMRLDEATLLLEQLIVRQPLNDAAHAAYNDLLYRLGRDSDLLKSYDPAHLTMGKAAFLLKLSRDEEAHALYAAVAARDPANLAAHLGAAAALCQLKRPDEAMKELETELIRNPNNIPLHHQFAAAALQARDPQKAVAVAKRALALVPLDQYTLALLGSAWRMMDDERDEVLNGYNDLIQVFDLEPPEGFPDMATFNTELNAWLDRMHIGSREPLNQTLRGGTQTRGQLFGQNHALVDKLRSCIAHTVTRYIAGLAPDLRHPFRSRVQSGFRFTGSWSSRLRDCGFHVNHIHPQGWISSCYYVDLPEIVRDESTKQGWIKFGEPGLDAGLGIRRTVQPRPGRLVLFPSYMWHGTIPFHDLHPRTTIAFDAVPSTSY